jgi:hypothetical protein
MSTPPEPDFDLEKLFLPAWAQEAPPANRYANFDGEERADRKFDDRHGRRPPRRDQPGGARPRGPRPESAERKGRRPETRPPGKPAPKPEPPPPLPVNVSILPEEKGVESLARQIRVTGRAYPLFDIAQLILQKPERHQIRFDVKKNAEGQPLQPLFLCALDDTLWLSEEEVVHHILARHFQTFYQVERTATEPPRGTYTFVAQCGLSGKILGPPNYHDYQTQLHKLHSERFAHLPFETFKARVKIVKDEAVVKQWIEDHSFKNEYNCLNVPEPKKLASRDEVAKHFREVHLPNVVKSVETHTLSGAAARQQRSPGLQRAVRGAWEDQRRFPLQVATVLSQQFAGHGLQFFKVNRTVTHVSVARPFYLDMEATPVSEGVKRIVDFINTHPKSTRRKLMEALAPAPAAPAAPVVPAPVASVAPAAVAPDAAAAPAVAPAVPAAEPAALAPEAAPEQTALASDLHWLIHEGHVIEFANGLLETAKKPLPRPPKPEKPADPAVAPPPPAPASAETPETAAAPPVEPAAAPSVEPAAETVVAPVVETPAEPVPAPAPAAEG